MLLHIFLLVGAAYARFVFPKKEDIGLLPFVTRSQESRICTELCISGLGGEPCGENCVDILPLGMPTDFSNHSSKSDNQTRRDACPVLCENNLGFPLCNCENDSPHYSKFQVDFVQICSFFCLKYNYEIYGCQSCKIYHDAQKKTEATGVRLLELGRNVLQVRNNVDWELWCQQQCKVGDGGAACNCDIIPFGLTI